MTNLLLTKAEAAVFSGRGRWTIDKWIRDGDLRMIDGRVFAHDVEKARRAAIDRQRSGTAYPNTSPK